MTKIEALKKTIETLRGNIYYAWTCNVSCNCGILAQVVTGKNANILEEEIWRIPVEGEKTPWARRATAAQTCRLTGRPVHEIIQALLDAGFTTKEIEQLELLSNPELVSRAKTVLGCKAIDRSNRGHLIVYLQEWAKQLETPAVVAPSLPKKEYKVIRVASFILDQELIPN